MCDKYDIKILALNSTEIHVHLLIQVKKWISITEVIWEIKGKSSFEIKKHQDLNLSWQTGYSIFTISEENLEKIILPTAIAVGFGKKHL